jgi:Mycothiol maleylpyruvate isomerase N-terminal domain
MSDHGIGARYSDAAESFILLARTLSVQEWAMPVPCTPGWTARDVMSHVAGIPDDGFAGRTDGAATAPWTASQVERNAEFSVDELLARWESQYALFGQAIEGMGEGRPPIDCHTHEHDVRHAIGRPGNRESLIIEEIGVLLDGLAEWPVEIVVTFDDGATVIAGRSGNANRIGLMATKFEVFRSRLGRRTIDQVRHLAWTGDAAEIESLIASWFIFGPSDIPIVE